MQEIPVPDVGRRVVAVAHGQSIGTRAVAGIDDAARGMGRRRYAGRRIARHGVAGRRPRAIRYRAKRPLPAALAVIVAIRDQRLQVHGERRTAALEFESQVTRIGAARHENPLFQDGVGDGVAPHRHAVLHGEGFQVHEAAWIDGGADEFVGGQRQGTSLVFDVDVDLGHQKSAIHRRLEARHEKAMVAAGVGAGDGAAGIAPQAIGHQPLVRDCRIPVTADLASQHQKRARLNK